MGKSRFKRADGYRLCRGINGGECSCEGRGDGPCMALVPMLRAAGGDVGRAIRRERERIRQARRVRT